MRRQAASCIGEHNVNAARTRRRNRIEYHGSGVAPVLRDHGDVVPAAPFGQLLTCRSTEGIAGGQQHAVAFALELLGELADGGGLARAIYAGDHDDERALALIGMAEIERCLERGEQLGEQFNQGCAQGGRRFDTFLFYLRAQLGE